MYENEELTRKKNLFCSGYVLYKHVLVWHFSIWNGFVGEYEEDCIIFGGEVTITSLESKLKTVLILEMELEWLKLKLQSF